MELFHTSPIEIEKINESGMFGSFLFFSAKEYVMTAGQKHSYTIDVDDENIIAAESLYYHEKSTLLDDITSEFAERWGISVDDAEEVIAQRTSIHDIESNIAAEDLAGASWDSQYTAAKAARLLGFRCVSMDDEQGRAYLVDMFGRENEFVNA